MLDGKVIIENRNDDTIRLLIEDMGGHGRALETLKDCIDKVPKFGFVSFGNFMADFKARLIATYPSLANPPLYWFKAAMLVIAHKKLQLKDVISSSEDKVTVTVEELLQSGLFTLENERLKCAYILVWILAVSSSNESLQNLDFNTYNEQSGKLGKSEWQHFEEFLADYRVIKSCAFEGLVRLSEFHQGAVFGGDNANVEINSTPLKKVKSHHIQETKSINPNRKTKTNKFIDNNKSFLNETGSTTLSNCSDFVINAATASAGDCFGCIEISTKGKKELVHEVYQSKRIHDKITKSDYLHERKKAATKNDIFILFTTEESDIKSSELSEKKKDGSDATFAGIVTKSAFDEYFGLFAGRAFRTTLRVNVNVATIKQLMEIPSIGESKAAAIITEREKKPFADREDYEQRTGLKNTLKRKFSDFLTFDPPKNE